MQVATSDGTATAGTDYTATSQTLSWADGDSTPKTVSIPLLNDPGKAGNNLTVNLSLSDPTGETTLSTPNTAVLTVNENAVVAQPGQFEFSASTYSAQETDGAATITVDRAAGSSGAVTVQVATSDGTATAGTDYTATTQTLSWADGDSTPKTVSIPLLNDPAAAGSNLIVNLSLSDPTGETTLSTPNTAVLTINDNTVVAQPGQFEFSTATFSAQQTAGVATITVNQTGGSSGAVSVQVATSDGTANAGTDYTSTTQTLSWADGDSTPKTVTIMLLTDLSAAGSTLTVNLALSDPTGGAQLSSPSTATLSIHEPVSVPSGTNTTFVTALYNTILDRAPDASGLASWLHLLQTGTSLLQVSQAFWVSAEHRALPGRWFLRDLPTSRAADPAGRAVWTKALLAGESEGQVEISFLTSPEFQALHPSNDAFTQAAIAAVQGITADPAALPTLESLAQLLGRNFLAQALATSPDAHQLYVDNLYIQLLHRNADAAGAQAWIDALDSGQLSEDAVAEMITASEEYYSRAAFL